MHTPGSTRFPGSLQSEVLRNPPRIVAEAEADADLECNDVYGERGNRTLQTTGLEQFPADGEESAHCILTYINYTPFDVIQLRVKNTIIIIFFFIFISDISINIIIIIIVIIIKISILHIC